MVRKKHVSKINNTIETGYYDHRNRFILHSFEEHEPARISGSIKCWYNDGNRYWFINNKRYDLLEEVYKVYKDKIANLDSPLPELSEKNYIDFIYLDWDNGYRYLILDDTDRNEVILKYG